MRRRIRYHIFDWTKRLALLLGLLYTYAWVSEDTDRLNYVLTALFYLFQILFAVVFVLIQFVAIFWYLSRSRMEVILPSQGTHSLDMYWGQPELVRLARQWVELLRGVSSFRRMGAEPPRGVLLTGPPGSGKSYLAKCLAGSAGLPFIGMDAASLTSMFWGVGALKVIQFFRRAKRLAREYGAAIAFIDEIDAIAKSRWGMPDRSVSRFFVGMGGGSLELSTLLWELDGTMEMGWTQRLTNRVYRLLGRQPPRPSVWLFVMAATNIPEALDPAITRAGRLDRMISVPLPDREGRREIVKGYLSRVRHDGVDLDAATDELVGLTPAQISQVIEREGPRYAVFDGRDYLTMRDIRAAVRELRVGLRQPIRDISAAERKAVAVHEAGHAVLAWLLTEKSLRTISIVRYGEALGFVMPLPERERYLESLYDYWVDCIVSLGGRAAEIVVYGEPLASVGGDYHSAMHVVRTMLAQGIFGAPPTSEHEMARRSRELFDLALGEAVRVLRDHRDMHERLVQALLEKDELDHDEVKAVLGERVLVKVELPQKQRR